MIQSRLFRTLVLIFLFLLFTTIAGSFSFIIGEQPYGLHLSSMINQVFMWFLPAVFFAFFFYKEPLKDMRVKTTKLSDFGWGVLLFVVSYALCSYLGYLNEQIKFPEAWADLEQKISSMEESARVATMRLFDNDPSVGNLLLCILTICVIPAVCEEIFFRGVILTNLLTATKRVHLSVWLSALIFSAVHLQFYGLLPRWVMGAVLAYAFVYTRSIWVPILIHFINNLVSTFAYYMYCKGWIDFNPLFDETKTATWWAAVLSLILMIVLIRKKAISYRCNTIDSSSQ